MKHLKKIVSLLVLLAMTLCLITPALAEDYTYTVRIFAGAQGTINGQSVVVYRGQHYGDRINFSNSWVTLDSGSKYYVMGIRESGKDNSTVASSSIEVTGDMDYVVAYGIRGSSVAYTVYYQDEAGNELFPTATFYGNVGDKPVIAYQYVDGYQPQAYNLTKTLSENAAENVFTFIYTSIAGPEANEPEGGEGGENAVTPGEGTEGTENAEGTEGTEGNEGDVPENSTQPATENIPDANTPAANTTPPAETLDLDEPQAPLAGFDNEQKGPADMAGELGSMLMSNGVKIGICAGVAGVLALLAILFFWKRKKDDDEDKDAPKHA